MNKPRNTSFSQEELDFVMDAGVIEMKNRVLDKMMNLLAEVRDELDQYVKREEFFLDMYFKSGKISRGENLKGLPYLVLDHPAIFKKKDIFAFRTIFWWGNYFSHVFILRGKYFNFFVPKLLMNLRKQHHEELLVCVDNHPWNHKMEDNYRSISHFDQNDLEKIVADAGFLKIGDKTGLENVKDLTQETLNTFQRIQRLLA